jgi:hypothetical protein
MPSSRSASSSSGCDRPDDDENRTDDKNRTRIRLNC